LGDGDGKPEHPGSLDQRNQPRQHPGERLGLHRGSEPLLDIHHQKGRVLTLQLLWLHTAYPIAPAVAGACGSSITLTQATVPDASARSRAGRICAGFVTSSPQPPKAFTTSS